MQYFIANFDLEQNPRQTRSRSTRHRCSEQGLVEKSEGMKWSWAFYHAMTQLLAISVGVVPPMRPAELWATSSLFCSAPPCTPSLSPVSRPSSPSSAHQAVSTAQIDMLHQYMRNLRMPPDLCLVQYFELCFPDRQMFNERDIIDQLFSPPTVRDCAPQM